MKTEFSHEIVIDRSPQHALPLFTPKGEEAWVPGWRPDYIAPEDGATCEEMLFRTGDGPEETFWTCMRFSPEDGHARYLRITPASRIAFVDVKCIGDDGGKTRVRVAYETYPLGDAGKEYLSRTGPADFAAMIEEWGNLIAAAN